MPQCDVCSKEGPTHFIRADQAAPIYCDTDACCECAGHDAADCHIHDTATMNTAPCNDCGAKAGEPCAEDCLQVMGECLECCAPWPIDLPKCPECGFDGTLGWTWDRKEAR